MNNKKFIENLWKNIKNNQIDNLKNFYLDNATTKEILSKSFYDFYVSIIKQENQNNLLDVKEITIKS